ncbi:esterase/lipase family protein [Aureliella helgolandensis]|uniref:Alpha/beta hydrolase family protein n=1 Tax=Aureliella helgolandensis TaxID=2527968 RepID=A0A518G798_9BACT|nr:alpha/beta hydrolase [Aureliella helgolandensis]QDV24464.1 Alpha/beta hydrolase family protein [Aureliella helgolandensis]
MKSCSGHPAGVDLTLNRQVALARRIVSAQPATYNLIVIWLACLCIMPGCSAVRTRWPLPVVSEPVFVDTIDPQSALAEAESLYSTAQEHEHYGWTSCVDLYFEVAILTLGAGIQTTERSRELHRSCLQKIVLTGQRFKRLLPQSGLQIERDGEDTTIPVSHHGFVWEPSDFDTLELVGDYGSSGLRQFHRCSGAGIPLVVEGDSSGGRPFGVDRPVFAATLVLQPRSFLDSSALTDGSLPGDGQGAGQACAAGWELAFYDPLRVHCVERLGENIPLARDTSAPLIYRLDDTPQDYLANFISIGTRTGNGRLITLEPYQPGKIPVVFIHGLLSDPFTWAEMTNELQASPDFVDRYQIWYYEYPTGESFFFTAAQLREQLRAAREVFDPSCSDPQLSNIMLVGHSMGGLIAKLQVTSSEDLIWDAVANCPLEQVVSPPDTRDKLRNSFYFEPNPAVTRVVFIGTPHRGSVYARRLVGKIGSALVEESADRKQAYQQLLACNPGVFSREVQRRVPTSIDLLNPQSPLLKATDWLPIKDSVVLHSIVGTGRWTLGYGASDGVVPVDSAFEFRARSERCVVEEHSKLNQHPDTVDEVRCLLERHWANSQPSLLSYSQMSHRQN